MTCDTWHVTCDMLPVTRDMLWWVNILSKFQLLSSYCLWSMILWRSGGKGSQTELMNEWINDEAVYRTAPATPGLLKRGTLENLFIIHGAQLMPPISLHPVDQQGSPCCPNFMTDTLSYHGKVNLVGALDAEKLAAAALLYLLLIGFPTSLLSVNLLNCVNTLILYLVQQHNFLWGLTLKTRSS